MPKASTEQGTKVVVGGSWSDSENESEDKPTKKLVSWLNRQIRSPSSKVGLRFDKNKASTSETKRMSFVGSAAVLEGDGSTIKADGSTTPGSVDPSTSQKVAEHIFVIVRKKLIHKNIENSKRPPLKPSLKNGLGFVCLRIGLEPDEWIKDSG
ncbi:hypothetical protein Tco_1295162 [Tanacetum coccineum]